MIVPSVELLRLLSRTERAGLWLAEFCARRLPSLGVAVSFFPMGALVWLGIGRRLRMCGAENVRTLPEDSSLLLLANHRSFFDFFTIAVALRLRARLRHRIYFPVRTEFFYSHPLGLLVNLVGAGMSMFPPIFRSGPKRALNSWSLARCAEELAKPGTAVGLHPEGSRNNGPDPFRLQPARPGIGRIVIAVPHARVIPAFVLGLGNSILVEIGRNMVAPQRHPVWMVFGAEVQLADLQQRSGDREATREAAERCRDAIQILANGLERDLAVSLATPSSNH